jgi:phosphocarrier protein HPr
MAKPTETLTRQVCILNELGLHARPAAKIAELAKTAGNKVWVIKDDEKVDASSIIDILSLACFKGTCLTLQAEDPSDVPVLDKVAQLINDGFKE